MKRTTDLGYHCWVTNFTKRDILIGDLGVRIPAKGTVDLLDPRHSYLSLERVTYSLEKGSLARRMDPKIQPKQIGVRHGPPQVLPKRVISKSEVSFPNKDRSLVKIEEKSFPELELDAMDEENFAEEMAESALMDHAPTMSLLKSEVQKDKP